MKKLLILACLLACSSSFAGEVLVCRDGELHSRWDGHIFMFVRKGETGAVPCSEWQNTRDMWRREIWMTIGNVVETPICQTAKCTQKLVS